jgi:hypothetical protein
VGIPLVPNATFDLYRPPNTPPAAPTTAGVACHFRPDYSAGLEHGEGDSGSFRFDAVALVDLSVDIRDGYSVGVLGSCDMVFVPDRNGVKWKVVFVERVGWNTPHDHKRVYLQRVQNVWPNSTGI